MGIKTGGGNGGNVQFFTINQKLGCFTSGSGPNKQTYEAGRTAIEGVPYRLAIQEDTFEDQKSLRANLYLKDPDGGPNMCVAFTIYTEAHEASSQGVQLLARLFAADTTKAVSIKPWFAEKGLKLGDFVFDREGGHISFKQQDQTGAWVTVKPDFAGRGAELPPMEERKIEGTNKTVKVKPGWTEIMEDLVGKLTARLDAENPRNANSQSQQQGSGGGVSEADIDPTEIAGMRARG
ncbi:MAG: hypothetical protein K0Q43_56 [Ramlibacter sp.]|jgi:hypothetical protein|nr:hypothetical protein [Ramlibacter sp.]